MRNKGLDIRAHRHMRLHWRKVQARGHVHSDMEDIGYWEMCAIRAAQNDFACIDANAAGSDGLVFADVTVSPLWAKIRLYRGNGTLATTRVPKCNDVGQNDALCMGEPGWVFPGFGSPKITKVRLTVPGTDEPMELTVAEYRELLKNGGFKNAKASYGVSRLQRDRRRDGDNRQAA